MTDGDAVNFGELSPEINELLRQGVVAYQSDRVKADRIFREALAQAPHEQAAYSCLYKIHTHMGSLDFAAEVAFDGLKETARQAGWPSDPKLWPPRAEAREASAQSALYIAKALSFIELKRGRSEMALAYLRILSQFDPEESVGWKVVQELAEGTVR